MYAELHILYKIGECILALIGLTLNSLVVWAIWTNIRLHTPSNVFIAHLATADVIVCLKVTPLAIVTHSKQEMGFYPCVVLNSVLLVFSHASIIMLLCVALERFCAIRFPFYYHTYIDVKTNVYIGGLVWIFVLVLGLIPIFLWNKGMEDYGLKCSFLAVISYSYLFYFNFLLMFLLPMSIMSCAYLYIEIVVKKMKRRDTLIFGRFRKEMKPDIYAKHPFIKVCLAFCICKSPLNLNNCIRYFEVTPPWDDSVHDILLHLAILMSRANSVINPLIYAASNSRIRKTMINIAFCRPKSNLDIRTDTLMPTYNAEIETTMHLAKLHEDSSETQTSEPQTIYISNGTSPPKDSNELKQNKEKESNNISLSTSPFISKPGSPRVIKENEAQEPAKASEVTNCIIA